MAYEPLSKLYYKDSANYGSIYSARFCSESTLRLPVSIHSAQAFCCHTPEMLAVVERIYRLDKSISALWDRMPTKGKQRHYTQTLIEEALWSNDVEGIHSSRKELREAYNAVTTKQRRRFKGLVAGYNAMLNRGAITVSTPEDIRSLYDITILPDVDPADAPDGTMFRKDGVDVVSGTGTAKHSGISPESALIAFLREALAFLHNSDDSLIAIAAFHYLFGYAHPFYDGNGRMARFLSSLFLGKNLHLLIGLNMSQTISGNKTAYYNAFDVCNDPKSKGDITPFLLYYLSMIEQSALSVQKTLTDAQDRLEYYESFIARLQLSPMDEMLLQALLQVSLFSDVGISIGGISRYMNCSESTARKTIQAMMGTQAPIIVQKSGRAKLYTLELDQMDRMMK